MRACGYGECRILPTSMPGTLKSSVYLPAPVVFSAASTIAVALPMMEKSPLISSRRFKPSVWPEKQERYAGIGYFSRSDGCAFGPTRTDHFSTASPARSALIAERIASYIWLYPVQRQRLLLRAARTSASDGSAFSASSDFTVMRNPGVQYPHCAPPQSP